jgi:hypothetical protein
MMKLIRFDDWQTGLLVQLREGPYLVDVIASLGLFAPVDPIASGVLNSILKDGKGWAPLIEHWDYVRVALRRLAVTASTRPDHPSLTMRPFDGVRVVSPAMKRQSIATLEIAELADVAFDPTGRATIERQSASPRRRIEIIALHDRRHRSSRECKEQDPYWWNRQG